MKKFHCGFHLIEILIVLIIVGLLAVISIPTYSQYFVYEKRLEAEMMLTKIAIALEHYFIQHNTYQGATLKLLQVSDDAVKKQYHLIIQSKTNHDFLLAAIPIDHQADHDKLCGTLTLNSLGEKNISGLGTLNECW